MQIIVTGGAGYVGSALIPKLLEKNHKIVIFDTFYFGYRFPHHPNLKQYLGDIRDKEQFREASLNCDAMIHLAAISNDASFDLLPQIGKSINFDAIGNIIDVCRTNDIQRLIVASSTSQYGIKPINMDVTEDTEADPITDYAKYKIECEKLISNSDIGNTEYVFARPGTIYGYAPRMRLDLVINALTISALVNKKIKIDGGKQMRPILHIKDMIRFYELLIEAPSNKIHKEAFNIVSSNNTIEELAKKVKNALEDESVTLDYLSSNDMRSYHINADKIKDVLNFECRFEIEEGIRDIQNAYKNGLIENPFSNSVYYNVMHIRNYYSPPKNKGKK